MADSKKCGVWLSLDCVADTRRDVYTDCTLPAGHTGRHRHAFDDQFGSTGEISWDPDKDESDG